MKKFTYEDIVSWDPCYDPIKWIDKKWRGTAIDILRDNRIPASDRMWCVLREELLSPKHLRLFAVWCAREAFKVAGEVDPRSVAAIDVAERYANGEATEEELKAAVAAAAGAARAATWAASAMGAAWAAWAARAATWAVTGEAAWAARAAEREKQIMKLIDIFEKEGL